LEHVGKQASINRVEGRVGARVVVDNLRGTEEYRFRSVAHSRGVYEWGPFGPLGPAAHLIAQNAHHQTDTDLLDRHTSLIPRALAIQADTPDRFLCFDSPQLHQTTD